MRLTAFIFAFFISVPAAFAAPEVLFSEGGQLRLSPAAKVSVITCGAGDEIYSVFGHTALRITDPVWGMDRVYNYGTFSFDTPGFAFKFAGGRLLYFLSVAPYETFARSYKAENRSLSEQVLNLSQEERQKIFDTLEENLEPEHKYYYYQFFSDNCTSRVYDLLKEVPGTTFTTDTSYIQEQLTFRELIHTPLQDFPWLRTGMNIGLGLEADRKTHLHERIFLPKELEAALDHSRKGGSQDGEPLVKEKILLFKPLEGGVKEAAFMMSPMVLLSLLTLLVALLSWYEIKSGIKMPWADCFIFGFTGFLGVVLLMLWIFSAHTPTHYNHNILWLNPLNLLMVAGKRKSGRLQVLYSRAGLVLMLVLVVANLFWSLFIPEFYPVALMLAMRFLMRSRWLGEKGLRIDF